MGEQCFTGPVEDLCGNSGFRMAPCFLHPQVKGLCDTSGGSGLMEASDDPETYLKCNQRK